MRGGREGENALEKKEGAFSASEKEGKQGFRFFFCKT